jgi:GT2 family glycosyltransferase
MQCTIIVPVHNNASLTRRCLDTILGQDEGIEYVLVVVDDASTDETPRLLASYGERIRVVRHSRNTGFSGACNDGASAAPTCEHLVFLNNDTIPQTGWLRALVGEAAAHPSAAVVGSKLLFPTDLVQHAGVVVCQDRLPRHLYEGFPAGHPAVNKSRRFQIVTGACMLIRRAVFEQANGFDPAFVNSYEDVDLCLRLGEVGHEVRLCHESVLYHMEALSRGGRGHEVAASIALYRSRWGEHVRPDEFDYYVEDELLKIEYSDHYPIHLTVSPQLAAVYEQPANLVGRILAARGQQVYELLRENIHLLERSRNAEDRLADRGRVRGEASNTPKPALVGRVPES